jgi:hypothetical protein
MCEAQSPGAGQHARFSERRESVRGGSGRNFLFRTVREADMLISSAEAENSGHHRVLRGW